MRAATSAFTKVPTRVKWAVGALSVCEGDRILEVGFGRGAAIELICTRHADARVTGVDRSAAAVRAAAQRMQAHVDAGRVHLIRAALADAPLGDEQFNKIFAINVNLFWLAPKRELTVVRRLLEPGGNLYLFYEPPSSGQQERIFTACTALLQEESYTVVDVSRTYLVGSTGLCIIATPDPLL